MSIREVNFLVRDTILVADDMEVNRYILSELFSKKYRIIEAKNGIEAIGAVKKESGRLAVILLDIVMPEKNGIDTFKELADEGYTKDIPVIFVTGQNSSDVERTGYSLGVADIIQKPFDVNIVYRRVRNIIDLYEHKNNLEELVDAQTAQILEKDEKLREFNDQLIDTLSSVVEFRDSESGGHIQRIKGFTKILLEKVTELYPERGYTDEQIDMITKAAAMHDIGKIAIPDNILLKPGRLTSEEFDIMKTHTTKGCEILQHISFIDNEEFYGYCYNICRHHHEKYDGRGYPDALKGDDIPLEAQIVSIADIYDALVSVRVYKAAYSYDEAYNMILNGECGQFSEMMMDCFKAVKDDFEALARKNKG